LSELAILLISLHAVTEAIQCLNTSDDLYYFPVECPPQTRFCLNVARIERRVADSAVHGILIESKECDDHQICQHMRVSPLFNHKINSEHHFNQTGCVVTPHLRVCCCTGDYCNQATVSTVVHSALLVTIILLLHHVSF
ncbi:hypothetical protein PENTCL1PPCAC_3422, partial [Pristionchus entomophagus]